ncbi:hypothetical protein KKC08_05835 [Patescibacteria group bacterium]|nr:hypothetical protein [Patescibacteria group bacterium]MCG2702622.1 hypothetical protein [Candidatus Parcubacteria bacterium]MBU4265484.1 hypothetical protein [Patescibacteria group bacterium]MBU4390534.1 hypothetical protein [Patescibacteria group bacterium]MBU4397655.1 hypothetical protein [Patescibacteria group bacterium]
MKLWQSFLVFLVGFLLVGVTLNKFLPQKVLAQDKEFCDSTGHGADSTDPQVNTALGCIPVQIDGLVAWLLPYLFGIIGGISFLLMVYSFILLATSGGDPKKVQGAKETLTSAVTGLLLSIFALFILKLIAVDILKIPGLN